MMLVSIERYGNGDVKDLYFGRVIVDVICEGWRGDDLGDDIEIIVKGKGVEWCEEVDEELVLFGWESYVDGWVYGKVIDIRKNLVWR